MTCECWMGFHLDGKVAVATGASNGVGSRKGIRVHAISPSSRALSWIGPETTTSCQLPCSSLPATQAAAAPASPFPRGRTPRYLSTRPRST
jgi:hypothetical protein